jgi:hypothetical protein
MKALTLDNIIKVLTDTSTSMKQETIYMENFLKDYAFGKKYEFILIMDGFKNLENFIADLKTIKQ